MRASLEVIAAELTTQWGNDPQRVGAEDGTEDDFGDLISDAARLLERDPDLMSDEDWMHFQEVAAGSRSTTMRAWIEELAATE